MNSITILAMTFGESLTRPFWEDPERFMSPGYLGLFGALYMAWKSWRKVAEGGTELREFIKVVREAWPLIAAALAKIKSAPPAQVTVNTPAAVVTQPAAQQPAPTIVQQP